MTPDRFGRLAARAYRLLVLLCYPRGFRHEYGADMADTFGDQYHAARKAGLARVAALMARTTADVVVTGLGERLTGHPVAPDHTPGASRMFYWQDVRYAARLLARQPLFTLLTVLVLAGGLALSIFTFSFLHTAILKPLPVADGGAIVRLQLEIGGESRAIDAADLAAVRPSITTLSGLGAYVDREVIVGEGAANRNIQATATEWNIFEVTGTRPAMGRGLGPGDQEPGAEPVIVLSDRTWRRVFGEDSSIVGGRVLLNGTLTRVVGVMPPGYGFPVASEAWLPIRPELLTMRAPGQEAVQAYARLRPGLTARQADAELTVLLGRVHSARPPADTLPAPAAVLTVVPYPVAQIGEDGPLVLLVLNTLAGLILLLACINVTNLLLARANERARETAVRMALGAPRARLVMQSLWESVILCVTGGVLATLLATWGLEAVTRWTRINLEGNMPFWWVWGFDRGVLLAAGGFVTLAVAVLGGVVATRAARTSITAVLQDGPSAGAGRREGRFARVLVVIQVATVSVLMFFGTMSAVVAWRVEHIDLGYDTRNLLQASVELPGMRYVDATARDRFFQEAFTGLASRPEIDGVVLRAPLADISREESAYEIAGGTPAGLRPHAFILAVLGQLAPLGIGLREGRFFDSRDGGTSEGTVILSASLAARIWPGVSPIGRQVRLAGRGERSWRTVVGVVDDVLLGNPLSRNRSPLAMYIPLGQADLTGADVVFRYRSDLPAGRAAFHQALNRLDPLLIPSTLTSFEEMLGKTTLIARSVTRLFAACFGFALLLALTGVYGLMARSIGRRTRELGVRRALGASDRVILGMLLGQGARQLGAGALVALPLTLAVAWGFSRYFPIAFTVAAGAAILVSLTIVVVVVAATWLPTRRAVAIQPRDALWRD